VIELPEDNPIGVALGEEGERTAGEENQETGDTPRPQMMPAWSIHILCRGLVHSVYPVDYVCSYILKSPAVMQGKGQRAQRARGA
jgi:hypothetical protein